MLTYKITVPLTIRAEFTKLLHDKTIANKNKNLNLNPRKQEKNNRATV